MFRHQWTSRLENKDLRHLTDCNKGLGDVLQCMYCLNARGIDCTLQASVDMATRYGYYTYESDVPEMFYRYGVVHDLNLTYPYKRSANLPLPSVSAGLGAGSGIFGASKSHSSLSLPYTSRKLDAAPFSCTSCRAV